MFFNGVTDEDVENSEVVPKEATGYQNETVHHGSQLTSQRWHLGISRNMVEPSSEEIKRVDASLHSVHCITGRCSTSTLADRLKRNGPPHWVCKRAAELTCVISKATSATKPSDV